MADVRPFVCVRPAEAVASEVAALPYDVYSREEAREAVKGKPLSFLNIDRAETQFTDEVDIYDPRVYEKARELLQAEIADGTFVTDEGENYYLYRLTMNGRSQTGIVACCAIDDYRNGVIKKHENTREEKEQDRIRHVDVTGAHTGPIFLAYRRNETLARVTARVMEKAPLYDFVAEDGIGHTVWRISDRETVDEIRAAFGKVPCIYIADGHHRAASAVKVGLKRRAENPGYTGEEPFNYFLAVLFPEEQLMIMPYNRVVRDLNGLSEEEFLEAVRKNFEVEAMGSGTAVQGKAAGNVSACEGAGGDGRVPVCRGMLPGRKEKEYGNRANSSAAAEQAAAAAAGGFAPSEKGTFGMYLGGVWYKLTAKPEILAAAGTDPVKSLDVSVLQDYLLGPVLGIGDPRTDKRIDFIGGIRGLGELERRVADGMAAAFSMYPTSIQELFAVADAGLLMPPKSTWFEPKLRSGLFIHRI